MEQTRALNALEPFLALSRSATSPRAACDLIVQATSAPNTYVFAELLQAPNIQSLRSAGEHAAYLALLEVFAWGCWADYKAHPNVPKLSSQQHQKLLLLSLLPLSRSHSTLTYDHLLSSLDLPSTRALEELVITAIYAGLITATLDPAHSRVAVTSVAPLRDLPPGSLPALKFTLQAWSHRCDSALVDLEAQVEALKKEALAREKIRRKRDKALEAMMQATEEKVLPKRPLAGPSDGDAMEVDDEGGSTRQLRGSGKKGHAGFGFGGLGRRLG